MSQEHDATESCGLAMMPETPRGHVIARHPHNLDRHRRWYRCRNRQGFRQRIAGATGGDIVNDKCPHYASPFSVKQSTSTYATQPIRCATCPIVKWL